MRKFLSICLAVTMMFSLMITSVVSADTYNFDFGTPTIVDESTVTIPVVVTIPNATDETWLDSANLKFDCVNCEVSYTNSGVTNSTAIDGSMNLFQISAGVNGFQMRVTDDANNAEYYGITTAQQKAGYELVEVTVTKLADDATITFATTSYVEDSQTSGYKYSASSSNSATLNLWKSATEDKITDAGWTWTDATAYKVSTTVDRDVTAETKVSCVLNASYTKEGNAKSKQIYSADLAGIYATSGSTISFRPILKGTDTISDLVLTGTFTIK